MEILFGLLMKTPTYGLVAAQPKDVYAYLREQPGLKNLLGTITRSDGKTFETIDYSPVRANMTFTAIDGLDVVVSDAISTEDVPFEDGTSSRYNLVTIYSAVFAGGSQADLRTELDRAGYTSRVERTVTEAHYTAAVGGTGSYSAASAFYRTTIRAGAGRKVATQSLRYTIVPEVGQRLNTAEGGYEFTGGFTDRTTGTAGVGQIGDNVLYTAEMVTAKRWLRFGFNATQQDTVDQPYWTSPAPEEASGVGLFGGSYMPSGVESLFDFTFNAPSFSDAVEDGLAALQYTAAEGSFDFTDCRPGDLALIRFDFNVTPQIANTTMEVALIWQTRAADGTPTFTFPLTGNPIFLGAGSVAQTFLARPLLSAYFASDEDVNARALLAIRADNPIQIQPLTTLVTIQR